ncbi:MAG: NADH-quinone oxidoreductase subunit J [Acidobacteria bacterium]|nr:NADH-quinone oxidoreductase subunit J [Acidobacteriota bacterium]MBV9928988.1 NADH-quinone oxidoreductase subunit J [Acidobacteriota bacterium]
MVLSGWESVFFWVFALSALVAGLLTVMARNAVHSALFLISTLVSVAALFVLLGAEFIAGVQILVYVGGVMVLFLFVIMLVNVSAEERGSEELFNRTGQVTAAVCFVALLVFGLFYAVNQSAGSFASNRSEGAGAARLRTAETGVSKISEDTQRVGASLYRYGALPFEIASLLLLVAIVGSVLLARTSKQELVADDVDPRVIPELSAAGELTPAEIEAAARAKAFEV